SADGTWTAGSWESRTPPSEEPLPMLFGGGFYYIDLLSSLGLKYRLNLVIYQHNRMYKINVIRYELTFFCVINRLVRSGKTVVFIRQYT
ncbi:hypothetical protein, partial [Paenibacillus sp. MYb67]|uniref:hypothetical protein n=1 Tax=Paenibacillus sp. MYb67 TaxID=2033725 RepID=UPI001C6154F1